MHKLLLDLPTCIETERLYLRCYERGDGPWYYAMSQRNREHLGRYESENPILSIENEADAEVVVREFAVDWAARSIFFLGAFLKTTHVFVAQVSIGPVNWGLPEFEIGYFVDKEQEGKGYVTEAVKGCMGFVFHHLGALRVSLHCDDTNALSYRVAERCGFTREGHLRQNKRNADGTLTGTLCYGLIKEDWKP